jgi:hypothetical protein
MSVRRLALTISIPFLLTQSACDSGVGPGDVATVTVAPSSTRLAVGDALQLTATAAAGDGTVLSGRATTWQSSDPAAATVDASGLMSAVAIGTATITATVEGKTGTAAVSVTGPSIQIVSGDGQQITVTDTATVPLVVAVHDRNGLPLPGVAVTFLAAPDTAELISNFVTRHGRPCLDGRRHRHPRGPLHRHRHGRGGDRIGHVPPSSRAGRADLLLRVRR